MQGNKTPETTEETSSDAKSVLILPAAPARDRPLPALPSSAQPNHLTPIRARPPLPSIPIPQHNQRKDKVVSPTLPPKRTHAKIPNVLEMEAPSAKDSDYHQVMLLQLCQAMLPLLPNPTQRPKLEDHHHFNTKKLMQALSRPMSQKTFIGIMTSHQKAIGLLSTFVNNLLVAYINTGIIPGATDEETTQKHLAFYVSQAKHNGNVNGLEIDHDAILFFKAIQLAKQAEHAIQERAFNVCRKLHESGFSIGEYEFCAKKKTPFLIAKLAAIDSTGVLVRDLRQTAEDKPFRINNGKYWWSALFEAAAADHRAAALAIAQRYPDYQSLTTMISYLDDFEINLQKIEHIDVYKARHPLSHHKIMSMKLLLWDIVFILHPSEAVLPAEITTYYQKKAIHDAQNIKTISEAIIVLKNHVKKPYMTDEKPEQHRMFSPSPSFKQSFVELLQSNVAKLAAIKRESMTAQEWLIALNQLTSSPLFTLEGLGLRRVNAKPIELLEQCQADARRLMKLDGQSALS